MTIMKKQLSREEEINYSISAHVVRRVFEGVTPTAKEIEDMCEIRAEQYNFDVSILTRLAKSMIVHKI